jgi:hypothetical protein
MFAHLAKSEAIHDATHAAAAGEASKKVFE